MRVLVVEDEPKVARFLKQALEEEGHAVDAAGDGIEAGNLAHINPYDLILLDVQLPRMNGLQLAAELRRTGVQSPILMLTSRDSTQDVVRGPGRQVLHGRGRIEGHVGRVFDIRYGRTWLGHQDRVAAIPHAGTLQRALDHIGQFPWFHATRGGRHGEANRQ